MGELALWFAKYWLEILLTGFLGGISIAAKFIWNTIKKEYLDAIKKNQDEIKSTNEKFAQFQTNIDTKFDKLSTKIDAMQETSRKNDLAIIKDSLLRKIRHGLSDDCVSLADMETAAALMSQYEALGGNGEVHKLYKRYEKLHVCPEYDPHYYEMDGINIPSDK